MKLEEIFTSKNMTIETLTRLIVDLMKSGWSKEDIIQRVNEILNKMTTET